MALTFSEFMAIITERYYEPDEKLPSGKTPKQKANASLDKKKSSYYSKSENNRTDEEGKKITTQADKIKKHVNYGADNKNFRDYDDDEVKVTADSNKHLSVEHPRSGVKYSVGRIGKDKEGRDVSNVVWTHNGNHVPNRRGISDPKKNTETLRSAMQTWDKHVSPRLPHNSVLVNSPTPNSNKPGETRNTRAKLYQRSGFGELNKTGEQFAQVGREPSPKQRAKGKTRLKPLSPDTHIDEKQ